MLGDDTLKRSFDAVKPGGTIVSIKGDAPDGLADERDIAFHSFFMQPNGEQLAEMAALITDGTIRPVLVTAFSTSSRSATLPAALASARGDLGMKPTTAGFGLPLGTTMNMAGTALYEGCVVLFVAQVFGVHLGFGEQVTLVFLSVLSAVAVAAIPGGSLPLIAGLLVAFGVPPEGIGIVLGVDRVLDMARSMTNVGSDLVTTVVVDAHERKADAASA